MPDIHPHQGDGTFENISHHLDLFAVPGYCIKMPQFELAKPYQAEYQLTNLPNIRRRCHVFLAVNTNDDTWEKLRKNFAATFQLELRDSTEQMLIDLHGNLSDYTAYSSTRMDFIALYPRAKETSFFPEAQEKYTVHIKYRPNLKLEGYSGFVYFECGGSK